MKRILKIFLITFLCVVGAVGLFLGGMILFTGVEQKSIYAENLSFVGCEETLIEYKTFPMQIKTTTNKVNKNKLRLISNNDAIIDYPTYVEIGEIFTVLPKTLNGTNVGGLVKLTAYYDDTMASASVKAECEILIDVPIEKVSVEISNLTKNDNISVSLENSYTLFSCGEKLNEVFSIYPENALMPNMYSDKAVDNIVDKALFIKLTDKYGNAVNDDIAYLQKGKKEKNSIIYDNKKLTSTKINYSYRDADNDGIKEIVIEDYLKLITAKKIADNLCLSAFVYSTYEEQQYYVNDLGEVDVNVFENSSLVNFEGQNFAIGNYNIVELTISNEDNNEVYLNLTGNDELVSKIYLNNSDASGNDINLGAQLVCDSQDVEVSDLFLLNTYIKFFVENGNEDFQKCFRLKNSSEEDKVLSDENNVYYYKIPSNFKKQDLKYWSWDFTITDFKAYYNYVKNGAVIKAQIKYDVVDENGVSSINQNKEDLEKEITIIPIVKDINSVIKKQDVENISYNNLKNIKPDELFNISCDEDATFKTLKYYLSVLENPNLSVIPSFKAGDNYKLTFCFELSEDVSCSDIIFNLDNFNDLKIELVQGDNYFCKNSSVWGNNGTLKRGEIIYATFYLTCKSDTDSISINLSKSETGSTNQIKILNLTNNDAFEHQFKFYQGYVPAGDGSTGETNYKSYAFLKFNKLKYNVDFDYYYDSVTSSYFLQILDNENNDEEYYKTSGIGDIKITAQLVYEEVGSENNIFWLVDDNHTLTQNVNIYQELGEVIIHTSYSGENFSDSDIFLSENSEDGGWLYLTVDSGIETLKSYIELNKVSINVEQLFSIDGVGSINQITADDIVKQINAGAITFNSNWEEVVKDGSLVGFKVKYKVNEVYHIKYDSNNFEKEINFNVKINIDTGNEIKVANYYKGSTESTDLIFHIKDNVISSLTSNTSLTSSNPRILTADVSGNKVVYSGNSAIGLTFKDAQEKESNVNSVDVDFDIIGSSNINLSNLISYTYNSNEKKIDLNIKNIPFDENGVNIKMTVKPIYYDNPNDSEDGNNLNGYYYYNSYSKVLERKQYAELKKEFYFKIFGLNITIDSNNKLVSASKDEEIKLFGEDGLFNIVVKKVSLDAEGKIKRDTDEKLDLNDVSSITNFSDIINISQNCDWLTIVSDYTKINPTVSFVKDRSVSFSFKIGENILKINSKDSYIYNILSPFVFVFAKNVYAPNSNQTIVYYKPYFIMSDSSKINLSYDDDLNKFYFYEDESTIKYLQFNEEDKKYYISGTEIEINILSEAIDDGLKLNLLLKEDSININQQYSDITNLVSINDNNTINAKVSPEDYNVKIYYTIVLTDGGKTYNRGDDLYASIVVKPLFDNEDLMLVKTEENFTAGKSYTKSSENLNFNENLDINKIKSIYITASDGEQNSSISAYLSIKQFDVNSLIDSQKSIDNLGIYVYDLNTTKNINFSYKITFKGNSENTNNGYVILNQNNVEFKPNISLSLNSNNLENGDTINLTDNNMYDYKINSISQIFDINNYFECWTKVSDPFETSFEFDSNVFGISPSSDNDTIFILYVLGDAYENCFGHTSITFNYYAIGNNNEEYLMQFSFDINILNN